jgi:uncharacterized membrane protein HdeD (DUF308 family)
MSKEVMKEKISRQPWWVVFVEGILALVTGALLLISPERTVTLLVQFLGIFFLVAGVIELVSIFVNRKYWGLKLVIGTLGVIAGILVLQHPLWSAVTVATTMVVVLGFYCLVKGIFMLLRGFGGEGWGVGILGVVVFLIGIFLLANTLIGIQLTVTLSGIALVVGGIAAIVLSFRIDDSSPQQPQI